MTSRTCDTSVLVPALAAFHEGHVSARRALRDVEVVPAHVLVETYSVLTRLPGPHRLAAADARLAVTNLPFRIIALLDDEYSAVIDRLAAAGVGGGAVYDGLVAATAAHHELLLLTRDRRAITTYDALGCRYSMV
ncbi:MAG: PIN domain-containing protein [Dermatophilaceae bacterium]